MPLKLSTERPYCEIKNENSNSFSSVPSALQKRQPGAQAGGKVRMRRLKDECWIWLHK